MAGITPGIVTQGHDLASPGIPNTQSPAKVRGSASVLSDIQEAGAGVQADVFETFRGARDAMLIHCPAGLNHAISLARTIRNVTR